MENELIDLLKRISGELLRNDWVLEERWYDHIQETIKAYAAKQSQKHHLVELMKMDEKYAADPCFTVSEYWRILNEAHTGKNYDNEVIKALNSKASQYATDRAKKALEEDETTELKRNEANYKALKIPNSLKKLYENIEESTVNITKSEPVPVTFFTEEEVRLMISSASYLDIFNAIQVRAKSYARSYGEKVLEKAAENAEMIYHDGFTKEDKATMYFQLGADNLKINKQSITNPKNLEV